MISSARVEIINKLQKISELAPEVRFGQLIANLAFLASGPWNETLWNITDEQLLAGIDQHLADLTTTQQHVA